MKDEFTDRVNVNKEHKVMKYIKLFGNILVILSVFFIIHNLYKMDFNWNYFSAPYKTCFIISLLSLLAVFNNYINAYVWKKCVDYFSGVKNDTFVVTGVYLKANIQKYLPGNVIQYAGRNLLGKNQGISQKSIAMASVLEILFISSSGVIFSFVISLQNTKSVIRQLWKNPNIRSNVMLLVILAVLFFCGFTYFVYKKKYWKIFRPYFKKNIFVLYITALLFYVVNFMVVGLLHSLIFILILRCEVNYMNMVSTNVLAWLAGYIVPGSPGGIGIRESVLVLLLGSDYSRETVAFSAILLRVCAVLGDLLSYLTTLCLEFFKNKREEKYVP